jgi:hypothetical protein
MKIIIELTDFEKIKKIIGSDITFKDLREVSNQETRENISKEKPELAEMVLEFTNVFRKNIKRNYWLKGESFNYKLMRKIASYSNGKYTVHQI